MNQSSVIAGFLFISFVIFITMKGKLPKYMGYLVPKPTPVTPASTVMGPR